MSLIAVHLEFPPQVCSMKKKDRAGENIVCLLDDFRMIGENGFHILLLIVLQLSVSKGCAGESRDNINPTAVLQQGG